MRAQPNPRDAPQNIGTLGGKESAARGINSSRQITGYSYNKAENYLAFIWQDGAMTRLGTLGGDRSQGNAINEAGQIVGQADTTGNEGAHAFLWSGGRMTDLGDIGFRYSNALALNSTGTVVVGYARYGMNYRAMVWTHGKMSDLNTVVRNASEWLLASATGIDDTGAIVGYGTYRGQEHAFLLTPDGSANSGRRRVTK